MHPVRCAVGSFGLFFVVAVILYFFSPELTGQSNLAAQTSEDDLTLSGMLFSAVVFFGCLIASPLVFARK